MHPGETAAGIRTELSALPWLCYRLLCGHGVARCFICDAGLEPICNLEPWRQIWFKGIVPTSGEYFDCFNSYMFSIGPA